MLKAANYPNWHVHVPLGGLGRELPLSSVLRLGPDFNSYLLLCHQLGTPLRLKHATNTVCEHETHQPDTARVTLLGEEIGNCPMKLQCCLHTPCPQRLVTFSNLNYTRLKPRSRKQSCLTVRFTLASLRMIGVGWNENT